MNTAPIITLRPAGPGDLAGLDAIYARSYPALLKAGYPPSTLVLAVPRLARAQPRLVASGRFYVAEIEGRLAGGGGWSVGQDTTVAHLRHLVTDHRQTHRGIGRALVEHIATAARTAGTQTLVADATLTAAGFYERLGFESLGEYTATLGPGITFRAVRMRRSL